MRQRERGASAAAEARGAKSNGDEYERRRTAGERTKRRRVKRRKERKT